MSRRGDNIRKRSDGRWEGRYRTISANGEKRYRSIYGKSYGEVKEKLLDITHTEYESTSDYGKMSAAINKGDSICFCSLMEEWLGEIERTRKYSTYVKYKNLYRCHIQNLFSNDKLTQITNNHIQNRMSTLNISDSTRQSVLAVIKQTLHYAEDQYGYPMVPVTGKTVSKSFRSIEIMNRTEQAKLMQFLHHDMDISKAGIFLCLSTGLRLGEVCALKWEDIDIEQKLLHVNRTVQRIESKDGFQKTVLLETTPKSFFSNREIPISDGLLLLLTPFKKTEQGYVLCANKPMEPRTYQNHFKRYLQSINVPSYNFHTLRHTFATNCIDNGMDIKSLSEILGHSDVQITLNRYVHPSMDTKRKYINSLLADYGRLCGQNPGNA